MKPVVWVNVDTKFEGEWGRVFWVFGQKIAWLFWIGAFYLLLDCRSGRALPT